MMTTDVKNPRGRNEDVPRGRGQIIRKHVLRSIQRNNKRVRNAVHVEHGKMRKEFIWLTLLLLCWSVAIVSSVLKTPIIWKRGTF